MTEPTPGDSMNAQRELKEQNTLTALLDGLTGRDGGFTVEGTEVRYYLDSKADEKLGANFPGEWQLTLPLSISGKEGAEALMVWIWEGAPEVYKKVILCHEVTEGLLVAKYGLKRHDAHLAARLQHEAYMQTHLTPEQQSEFAEWDTKLDHDTSEGEDE